MSYESHMQDWFQDSYRCAVYSAGNLYKSEIWFIFSCEVPITLLDLKEILHKLLCK